MFEIRRFPGVFARPAGSTVRRTNARTRLPAHPGCSGRQTRPTRSHRSARGRKMRVQIAAVEIDARPAPHTAATPADARASIVSSCSGSVNGYKARYCDWYVSNPASSGVCTTAGRAAPRCIFCPFHSHADAVLAFVSSGTGANRCAARSRLPDFCERRVRASRTGACGSAALN